MKTENMQKENGRFYATWMLGNNSKGSGYYGSYPGNLLKRVTDLFNYLPSKDRFLHLFSGSLPKGEYKRFDIRSDLDCEFVGDAEKLSYHFASTFDLIIADPPYAGEDAKEYGTPLVNRNKVVAECAKVLSQNGILVWIDQVWPMYKKSELELIGIISVIISTNHRVRALFFYEKVRSGK